MSTFRGKVIQGRDAANAVRLLLLTGARHGEVLSATWDQFDLAAGVSTKPSSHTKQKREHRVPLSASARQLLADMRTDAERRREASPYLFPARTGEGPIGDIKNLGSALQGGQDQRGQVARFTPYLRKRSRQRGAITARHRGAAWAHTTRHDRTLCAFVR